MAITKRNAAERLRAISSLLHGQTAANSQTNRISEQEGEAVREDVIRGGERKRRQRSLLSVAERRACVGLRERAEGDYERHTEQPHSLPFGGSNEEGERLGEAADGFVSSAVRRANCA